jgi:hypothetical protein
MLKGDPDRFGYRAGKSVRTVACVTIGLALERVYEDVRIPAREREPLGVYSLIKQDVLIFTVSFRLF